MKQAPVGIGIVGTGFARTTQIPGFRDCMGAKVVAIASRQRERAEVVAKEFGIDHVAHDWQELVQRTDVDLVSIVTPPSTHMEIALAALDQRKAVLCEKPMALNAEQSARMVEKAKSIGALALIDHELRFLNSRRVMRGMLQTGAIGTVRHCNYVFRSDYRALADRAWDWWSDAAMGGGTLGAIGSHVIDSFRWMLDTEISKTLGMLSTHIKQRNDKSTGEARAVTTDDEAKLLFRFADGPLTEGATGSAALSVVESGKYEKRAEIYGTKGALIYEIEKWDRGGDKIQLCLGSAQARHLGFATVDVPPEYLAGHPERPMIDFVEAVRAGKPYSPNFDDGTRCQEVLEAVEISAREGRTVRLPLDES